MKFLSSPSTVNSPGTYALRKPRLAKIGLPSKKFAQPGGVPHMQPVQKPKVKMISVGALAVHGLPKIGRLPKL